LRFVLVMSRWFLSLFAAVTLLASVPAVATDRGGSPTAIESPAPQATAAAIPVAATPEPHSAYSYRPYCDPHSDSYAARSCHASCAAWWCDLYWNQHP